MHHDKATQELMRVGMGLLGRREYSYRTLRDRLARHCQNAALLEQALAGLVQQGWQSDARYTEALVRQQLARGQGPKKIRSKLQQEGIAEDVIDQHLDIDEARWCALAEQARARRYGELPDDPGERARQARFLSARGFTEEHISRLGIIRES